MAKSGQTLSFLPHMQRGLAQHRQGDGNVSAVVTLSAGQRQEEIAQTLPLGGPEHVTQVSSAQILRMVPSPGSADFEPNFFPSVEFQLPDLPWMFSARGAALDARLAPWLVLVVVEVGAGVNLSEATGDSLAVLNLTPPCQIARELPDLDDAWAWAHVQCDADLQETDALNLFASQPNLFRSRLICPRRLKPLADYIACVVPATRGGVATGLGMEVGETPHDPAWSRAEEQLRLPVYHSWGFRTAQRGDFEDLVRRLSPIELEAGVVGLDLSNPGDPRLPADDAPKVMFKGALVGTAAPVKPWDAKHASQWRAAMQGILQTHRPGKSPDSQPYDALRDDPVVAPPLWGGRKIDQQTPPDPPDKDEKADWFSALNYHPSHRAAAGLGAECVRRNQEELMAEAWRQIDDLRAVNRSLNQTLLAGETTKALKIGKIDRMAAEDAVVLAGTARARLGARFASLKTNIGADLAPEGAFTPALARLGRRKGPLGKRTSLEEPAAAATVEWFASNPAQALSYADFVAPAAMANTDFIAQLTPVGLDEAQQEITSGYLNLNVVRQSLGGAARSAIAAPDIQVRPISRSVFRPQAQGLSQDLRAAQKQAQETKKRQGRLEARQGKGQAMTQTTPAGVRTATSDLVAVAFDPIPVLQARLAAKLDVPDAVLDSPTLPRPFLVTPEFDISGYTMLRAISADAIMPGVKEVPTNSVGLATVNAKFVESWLVGANAEMAREFLWREYPGRLDGTYFKRFWDQPGGDDDIAPIAGWAKALGSNQVGEGQDGTLVLLVKGEVLARFPELRIYASKARWDDRRFRYELRQNGRAEEIRLPLFGGWLDRSTAFFAFDLGLQEAKGTLELMGDAPGWFFVFEQPPEGVQFGLDVPGPSGEPPQYWADLNWSHALDDPYGGGSQTHLSLDRGVGVKRLQYDRDMFIETWGRSASAQARITLQRPARVLMHASGLLA